MNETEKAKELVEIFEQYSYTNFATQTLKEANEQSLENAKHCAIICVDNEKKALDRFAEFWDIKKGEWYLDECKRLELLKTEIEAL